MISTPVPRDVEPPCQADPERMFPVHESGIERAKTVCRTCPLVDSCFAYAICYDVAGVWGNSSERERNKFRDDNSLVPIPVVLSLATMRVYQGRVSGVA